MNICTGCVLYPRSREHNLTVVHVFHVIICWRSWQAECVPHAAKTRISAFLFSVYCARVTANTTAAYEGITWGVLIALHCVLHHILQEEDSTVARAL